MIPLRRHQLVRLTAAGWRRLIDEAADPEGRACLQWWADDGAPLVVCRQRCRAVAGQWTVGLAAPRRWDRARWTFDVRPDEVLVFDEFPAAHEIAALLQPAARPAWRALCLALRHLGVGARVYGSHGWQRLTGLQYLRASSDIDLCLTVHDLESADRAAALLDAVQGPLPRLDGELVLPDGSAVAWREWRPWRQGRVGSVLVKRLDGVVLEQGLDWLADALAMDEVAP